MNKFVPTSMGDDLTIFKTLPKDISLYNDNDTWCSLYGQDSKTQGFWASLLDLTEQEMIMDTYFFNSNGVLTDILEHTEGLT